MVLISDSLISVLNGQVSVLVSVSDFEAETPSLEASDWFYTYLYFAMDMLWIKEIVC